MWHAGFRGEGIGEVWARARASRTLQPIDPEPPQPLNNLNTQNTLNPKPVSGIVRGLRFTFRLPNPGRNEIHYGTLAAEELLTTVSNLLRGLVSGRGDHPMKVELWRGPTI